MRQRANVIWNLLKAPPPHVTFPRAPGNQLPQATITSRAPMPRMSGKDPVSLFWPKSKYLTALAQAPGAQCAHAGTSTQSNSHKHPTPESSSGQGPAASHTTRLLT
jgi:hypothetical protein